MTATRSAPSLDPGLLERIGAEVRRHIRVNGVTVSGGRAGSVSIDRLEVGEASIENVTAEDLSTHVKCGSVLLRGVRAIMELHFEVRWSYDLKWFGSDSGTKVLGSKEKTIPLHDIRIPMLRDIGLNVPETELTDIAAAVRPVSGISLGGASFEGLSVGETRLPSGGFQVAGLGFRSVEIERFAAPAADSDGLTVDRFSPDAPLRLPEIAVSDIALPEVAIPDVGSPEAVSIMDILPGAFEAPVFKIGDLFKAEFVATPVLHLQIGELVLSDLSASAAIGAVRVEGIKVPVTARGVRVGGLTLDQLCARGITV